MKLFYRKYGSGPPVIILHGLYGSSDNWISIARKISDVFTVYIPDQRNHGRSPHSSAHDYESMSNDLAELVEDLGIGKFILAGHSMGGRTAMRFALTWPEKLYSLLVFDISPFGTEDPGDPYFRNHLEILETILSVDPSVVNSRAEVEELLAVKIKSGRIRSFIMKNLGRTDYGRYEWKLNAKSLLDNLPKIMEGIADPETKRNYVTGFPVTFIKGEESDYIKLPGFRDIRNLFPVAEIITIKDAGHWIHAEKPDEVAAVFLAQI